MNESVTKIISETGRFLKRHGPAILAFTAGAGSIAGSILSARAALKVDELIRKEEENGVEFEPATKAKIIAKNAAIPTLVTLASAGSAVASGILGEKNYAALATVCTSTAISAAKFKKAVSEKLDETEIEELYASIAEKDREILALKEAQNDEPLVTFIDMYGSQNGGRMFKASWKDVCEAEKYLLDYMTINECVPLNVFYEALNNPDCPPTALGNKIGWNVDDNLSWKGKFVIDIDHDDTVALDDGTEAHIISFDLPPWKNFDAEYVKNPHYEANYI